MSDCRDRSRGRDRMEEIVSPISEPSFQRLFTELANEDVTESHEESLPPGLVAVLGESVLAVLAPEAVDSVAVGKGDIGERDRGVFETLLKDRKLLGGACELLAIWDDKRTPDKLLVSLSVILALLLRLLGSAYAVVVPRVISCPVALPTALAISSILSPLSAPSETPSTFSRLSSKLGAPLDKAERPKAGGVDFALSSDTDASDFFLTMERRERRSRGESRCSILVDHPLLEGVEADVGVLAPVVGAVGIEESIGSLGVVVAVTGLEASGGFEVLVSSIKYARDLLIPLASPNSMTWIFKSTCERVYATTLAGSSSLTSTPLPGSACTLPPSLAYSGIISFSASNPSSAFSGKYFFSHASISERLDLMNAENDIRRSLKRPCGVEEMLSSKLFLKAAKSVDRLKRVSNFSCKPGPVFSDPSESSLAASYSLSIFSLCR